MSGATAATLPVEVAIDQLVSALEEHSGAVLIAPPGSGKTTRVPLALLEREAFEGKLLMLQPRRVAARSTATWMAQQLGESVGGQVGYQVRHDRRTGARTRVEVITEGLLIQLLLHDPELTGIGAVILDEFHERSLAADLSLMMLLEARLLTRPDLKIIAMSATMKSERLCELLEAPLITAQGRSYPVDVSYVTRSIKRDALCDEMTQAIDHFWVSTRSTDSRGHCLVFLPGRREIEDVERRLRQRNPKLDVTPLYGALALDKQRRALDPQGPSRVILATNIAETSLTIDGVTHVIDSGFRRHGSVDAQSGLTQLLTSPIAQDSATQRAGRAGRTQEGVCLRLWTEHDHQQRLDETPAELREVDLSEALLRIAAWSGDWQSFTWFEDPPPQALTRAVDELTDLGVFSRGRGQLTALGEQLALLPAHPSEGLALCWATHLECLDEVALLCALAGSPRDVLDMTPDAKRAQDPWLRLEALQDAEHDHFWPHLNRAISREVYLTAQQLKKRTRKIYRRVRALLTQAQEAPSHTPDPEHLKLKDRVAFCFARSSPRRIGKLRERSAGTPMLIYHLSGGGEAQFRRAGLLTESALIIALKARVSHSGAPIIELALPIDQAWLRPRRSQQLIFDQTRGGVYKHTRHTLGQLVLEERQNPAEASNLEAQELFYDYVSEDPWRWITQEPAARHWLSRLRWLLQHTEIYEYLKTQSVTPPPRWSPPIKDLNEPLAQLVSTMVSGVTHARTLSKQPILPLILGLTPPEWTRWVTLYVPERFTLPTGQQVEVRYELGQPPTISAYVQAFFGERVHPSLGESGSPYQLPLRLELLAPNRRVAQITSDLPRFWASSYPDVRRDLRGRYPKHHWPEDPLSIGPQRGAKRRH